MRTLRLALAALPILVTATMALPVAAQAPAAAPPASGQAQAPLSEAEIQAIGLEAYTYLYSLITMDVTRRQSTNYRAMGEHFGRGPANGFVSVPEFPRADFRDVVRPNFDTLYSIAWLDLSQGPMVVSVPDTSGPDGRYYLMPMLDMWSNVFAAPGTRTTGTAAGDFAVVPPGWAGTLPAGVQLLRAPTPTVWVIGRTQTNSASDYAVVHRQQAGYRVTPLSRWGQPAAPATGTVDPTVDMTTAPLDQVNGMSAAAFFAYGAELMKTNPPGAYDAPILARMARLGIRAGASFDLAAAPPAVRSGLEAATRDGVHHLVASMPHLASIRNGWLMLTSGMGVYGTDYLRRAIVSMVGLGANLPEDAIYPQVETSADGRPLNGQNRYVLRFPAGQTPPVNAFWSLTMYDAQGFQVANPISRFSIGSLYSLTPGPDGNLDVLIQHDDPGGAATSRWLPAPAGPFNMTLRLYYPQAAAINGAWVPPSVTLQPGSGAVQMPR